MSKTVFSFELITQDDRARLGKINTNEQIYLFIYIFI